MLEKSARMNFYFVYGCRPSTGVKANTTMVKDIFDAFIKNADRINFMVLLPHAFGFLDGNDVSFETASSSRIKIIKLYYKHKIATKSIGIVFSHNTNRDLEVDTDGSEVHFHKILKHGLKVERVHTYVKLSLSQLQEKITWVIEMTTGSCLNCDQLQE